MLVSCLPLLSRSVVASPQLSSNMSHAAVHNHQVDVCGSTWPHPLVATATPRRVCRLGTRSQYSIPPVSLLACSSSRLTTVANPTYRFILWYSASHLILSQVRHPGYMHSSSRAL
ncbi:hypothetical protein FKP32DRAFT_1598383 [Trametes sanguinea]|nr:hypothetical protein FKP32DRAFT_1598383 [Trametes sanguinea]